MQLKRNDLQGKTGTTNDAKDGWFAGYQHSLVTVAWMGYDQPKSLGEQGVRRPARLADLGRLHGARAAQRTATAMPLRRWHHHASTASFSTPT